jgi:hypothetical protein
MIPDAVYCETKYGYLMAEGVKAVEPGIWNFAPPLSQLSAAIKPEELH